MQSKQNKKGEFVIEPQFDYADNFRDNMLATIKQDGKFGAINLRGEIVVPCKYILEEAMISVPISNKVYRQKQEEVKNAKGNGDFDDLLDKIAECSREVNEKINNPGAEVITDSLRIREDNGKMGLVVGGQTVIPTEYEELIIAEDGFVLACKQDKWGALDIYGRTILPCVYQWVYYDVSAKVWIAKSLAMGLYNSQGALLLPGRIDYIGSFVDGKAPVWLNSVLGWIDTKGQLSDGFAEDVTESFLKEEKKGVAGAWGMFNLLTDLIPDYAMAHYYMGKGQVTDGIYSKGMEHLKIAAELDPDNGEVALALKQAKKDKKKRTLNTIGYIASVHNDLESTNSNSFKDESRNQNNYYVRGTFTAYNVDFAKDVIHLADLGFKQTSVEPVVAPETEDYALTSEHIEKVCAEYDKLTEEYVKRYDEGRGFNFFHFMLDLTAGPCVAKRLAGCGSGTEYLAVTPWGDLYPCHQFVGNEKFLLGNVDTGIVNTDIRDEFKLCNVYAKETCKDCFARFYCSGGCSANAYNFSGSINGAYEIGCEMQKKRIECAIMIKAALADEEA